ncbi:MAG: hypothetical protein ACREF9_04350 [Opitutaceae bacterium]
MNLDVLSTIVGAAGGTIEPAAKLDGVDLVPYLTGKNSARPHQTLYWRRGPQWAVRHGDLKLVVSAGGSGEPELYDLATDIGESKNLARAQPAKVKELQALWNKWSAEQAEPGAPDSSPVRMPNKVENKVSMTAPPSASPLVVGLGPGIGSNRSDVILPNLTKELAPQSIRVGYEHGDHDFAINWAAENGIGVLFFLGYGKECDATTESGRQCYADRSAKLAKKYGDKVQYYEVWNEWNGGFGLGKLGWNKPPANDAAMYTDLLRRTYKAIKAVRPDAIIVGGSIAGANETFLSGMLDAGAGDCMDMLAIHLYVYRQGWPAHVAADAPGATGANRFIQIATERYNLVKKRTGKDMKILVTEAGFHSFTNENLAADYLTELYQRARTVPFIEGIWWYNLRDHIKAKKGELSRFGLVDINNVRKPAFAAFKAAAQATPPRVAPAPPAAPVSKTSTNR